MTLATRAVAGFIVTGAACFVVPPPSGDGAGSSTGDEPESTTGALPDDGVPTSATSTPADSTTAEDTTTLTGPPLDGGETTLGSDADSGSSTGPPGLEPDLVARYTFDVLSPPTVDDDTEFENDGACVVSKCPASIPGVVGAAASFDGIDDVVIVPHSRSLQSLAGGLTIATWLRIGGAPSANVAAVGKPYLDTGIANSWQIAISATLEPLMVLETEAGQRIVAGPSPIATDTWVHLAITWDGAVAQLWVDFEPVALELATTIMSDEQPVLIGADIDNATKGHHFAGALDDVRLYRVALSAEELSELAAGG